MKLRLKRWWRWLKLRRRSTSRTVKVVQQQTISTRSAELAAGAGRAPVLSTAPTANVGSASGVASASRSTNTCTATGVGAGTAALATRLIFPSTLLSLRGPVAATNIDSCGSRRRRRSEKGRPSGRHCIRRLGWWRLGLPHNRQQLLPSLLHHHLHHHHHPHHPHILISRRPQRSGLWRLPWPLPHEEFSRRTSLRPT